MMMLVAAVILAGPPVSDALVDMRREISRAQAVLDVLERRAAGERHATLRLREPQWPPDGVPYDEVDFVPWAMQATFGVSFYRGGNDSSALPPAILPDSGVSFAIIPNTLDEMEDTELKVEVCRGANCHTPEWIWQCSRGACAVQGSAQSLFGEDAGKHLLQIQIKAKNSAWTQEWNFVAAAGA